jgi:PAS domain S-box-containing protein
LPPLPLPPLSLPQPPAAAPTAEASTEALQPTRGRQWIGIAILALAFLIAWPMDRYLTATDPSNYWYGSVLPLPWIPLGLGVAALLIGGIRLWRIGYAATLVVDLLIAPGGWQLQVVDAASVTLATVWTVQLLHKMRFRLACDRFHDLLVLGAAAALGQAFNVLLSLVAVLLIASVAPGALTPELQSLMYGFDALYQAIPVMAQGMFRWWVAGVTGVVFAVPAVVSWSSLIRQRILEHKLEMLCWIAAVGVEQMTLLTLSEADWRLPILAGCIAVAVWAAVRFGAALAWTATLLVALTATIGFVLQRGVLAAASGGEGVTVLWGFIVLAAATVAVVTTLLAESEQAESHLRQLNKRYRALFDAVPHSLFAIGNPSGKIRLSNDRAREFYGYTSAEFEAMSLSDLEVGGGDTPIPALNEPFKITRRHADKSGKTLDVELALTPVEFDDGPGALCFSIDVTERNRLRTQMIESTDSERRRLALEFHDGLGQILTGLLLGIQPLLRSTERQKPLDNAAIDFVSGAGREALAACARILRGISPLQETGGDLLAALRRIPDHLPPDMRDKLTVSVSATSAVTLPIEQREHLYQIAREAANNSIKHANASRITVALSVSPKEIKLFVEDDGTGFDPTRRYVGLGLDSLRLRAVALNGRLRIARRGVRGMIVHCSCDQP